MPAVTVVARIQQRVAAHHQPYRGYRLALRDVDLGTAQVQVAVDLGPREHERSGQPAVRQGQSAVHPDGVGGSSPAGGSAPAPSNNAARTSARTVGSEFIDMHGR